MEEKRRSKRMPANLELSVSRLFRQETMEEMPTAEAIHVCDVSKHGIGFTSKGDFPMDYYFNAKLELGGPENSLYCVVQIVRKNATEKGDFSYGCIFVGMAPVLDFVFEEYEKKIEA